MKLTEARGRYDARKAIEATIRAASLSSSKQKDGE
jgi:hypothetical protein